MDPERKWGGGASFGQSTPDLMNANKLLGPLGFILRVVVDV